MRTFRMVFFAAFISTSACETTYERLKVFNDELATATYSDTKTEMPKFIRCVYNNSDKGIIVATEICANYLGTFDSKIFNHPTALKLLFIKYKEGNFLREVQIYGPEFLSNLKNELEIIDEIWKGIAGEQSRYSQEYDLLFECNKLTVTLKEDYLNLKRFDIESKLARKLSELEQQLRSKSEAQRALDAYMAHTKVFGFKVPKAEMKYFKTRPEQAMHWIIKDLLAEITRIQSKE